MNKAYRIVWNKARKCLMVVGENAKSNGKGSGTKRAIIDAIAAALLALGGGAAMAADLFVPGSDYPAYDTTLTLGSGDTLNIDSAGSVGGAVSVGVSSSGVTLGVTASGSYTFSILNAGTISTSLSTGGANAIQINNTSVAGAIINTGSISAINDNVVKIVSGSTVNGVIANLGGTITGYNAVLIDSSVVTQAITNTGVINGAGNSSETAPSGQGHGIQVANSATIAGIYNAVGAQILGAGSGLSIIAASQINGDIVNDGLIQGGNKDLQTGLLIGYAAASVVDGSVINNSTGTISGGNTGIAMRSGSIVNGNITNSGLISGGLVGISINSGASLNGDLVNSGSIGGGISNAGIYLGGAVINGSIANSGTITGGYGIYIADWSTLSGGITNSGSIAATQWAGIGIYDSSVSGGITNQAGGTIIGVSNTYGALHVENSTLTGGIVNAGLIENTAPGATYGTGSTSIAAGILLNNSSLSGGITNELTGVIVGTLAGIYSNNSTISGNIANAGLISAQYFEAGKAISLQDSLLDGSIVNTGTLTGHSDGVLVYRSSISGNIENSGSIYGSYYGGIRIENSTLAGSIINSVSGQIVGGWTAGLIVLGSSIGGDIVNHGTIIGVPDYNETNAGLYVRNTSINGSVINTGIINGDNYGIYINTGTTINGGITNQAGGTITGGQYGINIAGSYLGGSISNQAGGTITGDVAGIQIRRANIGPSSPPAVIPSVLNGGIINAGLIQGTTGTGIQLIEGSTLSGGITNQAGGTIIGGQFGIYGSGSSVITGGITNAGLIAGGMNSIFIGLDSSVDRIVIAGNNTASFSGDVFAPGVNVTVAGGSTYTMDSTVFSISGATFANEGTLIAPASLVARPMIDGNLALQSGGTFSPTVLSQTNYSQVTVTGNATIAGALAVNAASVASGALIAGTTLAGVISASSVSGSFVSTTDNSRLYNFVPVYGASELGLAIVDDSTTSILGAVQASNNPAAVGAAKVLDANAAAGLMPGVIAKFGQMTTDQQISNAVSQTLPVIVGAGSQATAFLQQNFNQIMQGRQNQLRGLSSGDGYIGNRDVWMKGFGSWADQGNINNVSGYKVNTGGLAIGIDRQFSPRANAGAVFAFANSGVSSNSSVAPSGITINSYQLGAYGDYALRPGLQANYQADVGLNNNKSYRNLSAFSGVSGVGANANANYNSLVAHLGAGLRQLVPVGQKVTFIPSVRADYTTVRSQAYTETGGGDLNLSVNSQTYNMLMLSTDLRVDYMLMSKVRASVNVGAGYNTLNNQVQVTSAYQGGGTAFVTNGLQVSPWLYNAGLGVNGWINKNTELNVRYDTQFSTTSYTNNMVSAKLKFWF